MGSLSGSPVARSTFTMYPDADVSTAAAGADALFLATGRARIVATGVPPAILERQTTPS